MTPTTRLPLVAALRDAIAERDNSPWDYDEGLTETYREAAALIEKQGAQIEALEAERVSLIDTKREQIEAFDRRVAELNRLATDRQYFMWAYESMLGENGTKVANMWRNKNVKRVHHSWGDEAHKLTGEERAAFILEWEAAPRVRIHDVDAIAAKTLGERE